MNACFPVPPPPVRFFWFSSCYIHPLFVRGNGVKETALFEVVGVLFMAWRIAVPVFPARAEIVGKLCSAASLIPFFGFGLHIVDIQ